MRRTSFQAIVERVGLLLNKLQPADIQETDFFEYAPAINDALKLAWEFYLFPELVQVQERAYMDAWDAGATYAIGDERYYAPLEKYYEAIDTTAAGESPETNPEKWSLITELDALIAHEQTGKDPLGDVAKVTARDPRLYPGEPELPFTLHADGLRVNSTAVVPTVWISMRARTPDWSGPILDTATAYAAGRTVYFLDAAANEPGDFWEALATAAAGETPLTHPAKWRRLEVPWRFRDFAAQFAYGTLLSADGQNEKNNPEQERAMARLSREIDIIEGTSRQIRRYTVVAPNA